MFTRQKRMSGLGSHEVFVPQSYDWGVEAQVDWYESYADLDGERTKLQVFEMRSMASGGAFHRAYTHATQQAFLEAHELAFRYFGGVFQLLRYDNLSSAVKKILRGHRREETSRFIAFRSHWRYQSEFCNPARGNEKGGVEGEGGYFRRNHWVPVPEARSLDQLNVYLERCSNQDWQRILSGRVETVGAAMLNEQPHLLPLAAELFDLAEISFPTVDNLRCVRVRTNRDPVPLPPGTKVEARASCRMQLSYAMEASALPGMNAATAASRRSSIWSTIRTCCGRSLAHWRAQLPWCSGGRRGAGQRPSISCGRR